MPEPSVNKGSLNPQATPFINRTLPPNQVCQSGSKSFLNPATETIMPKLTTSMGSKGTKSSVPPFDVVKFDLL